MSTNYWYEHPLQFLISISPILGKMDFHNTSLLIMRLCQLKHMFLFRFHDICVGDHVVRCLIIFWICTVRDDYVCMDSVKFNIYNVFDNIVH